MKSRISMRKQGTLAAADQSTGVPGVEVVNPYFLWEYLMGILRDYFEKR